MDKEFEPKEPELGNALETETELPEMNEIWQSTLGWQPSTAQQRQFQQVYRLILEGNRQLNLTRITTPQAFWEKHLWDSLAPLLQVQEQPHRLPIRLPDSHSCRTIDIGTGAGFPGVPVAIVHPEWSMTLLDSTRKKMVFLDQILEAIGLDTAKTLIDRAEQVGQHPQHRATYDLVLIRAVAAASVCAEYALPLLKVGGAAVLYRGQWNLEEETLLETALTQLGGEMAGVDRFTTPLSRSVRHGVYLKKVQSTPPEFPRAVGIPVQKPL
jgi:16S rRNA (guanine527-N7)-methyltransferase